MQQPRDFRFFAAIVAILIWGAVGVVAASQLFR